MSIVSQFKEFALRHGTVTPIGNETPTQIGDLYVFDSTTSSQLFIATGTTSSDWQGVGVGTWAALTAMTWTLLDNNASALSIGTTGFADMMKFITTNSSEAVTFGEGVLKNLPTASVDYAENTIIPWYIVVTEHPGGNAEEAFTLPSRTGGWRCVWGYVRNTSGTGGTGTLQLLDASGGNAISDAVTIGNDNVIVNIGTLDNAQETVGSGASPVWSGASSADASTCLSVWIGL